MSRIKICGVIFCCAMGLFLANCGNGTNGPDSDLPPADTTAMGSTVDSLFRLLIQRVQSLDTAGSFDNAAAVDFTSLRNGFSAAIAKQSTHPKANVGYMISALLSLNTSARVKNLADSLDSYFSAMNSSSPVAGPTSAPPLMKNALKKQGVIGLGKALAAKSGSIMTALAAKPSYPQLITVGYIQTIAEAEVIPVLDSIILAAQRLENRSDMAIALIVGDAASPDTFDLDKGEIYFSDAGVHLLRAFLGMFCAYNMELYAPGTTNYSWIDTLVNGSSNDSCIVTLAGDTLYRVYRYDDSRQQVYAARMFKYNVQRSGFLTIRQNNHARAKTDLLAVPALIKSGVTYIRNEADNQANDIIKSSVIDDADHSLLDFKTQLLHDSISPALANNFRSPEALADFITTLLSGPYTFDEKVGGVHVQLSVNLAAWFDNPVADLRTLFPHYTWTSENSWVGSSRSNYGPWTWYNGNSFTIWQSSTPTVVAISQTLIDSAVTSSYGDITYYLNAPIHYEAEIDSSFYIDPLRLLDQNDNMMSPQVMDSLIQAKTFFPYFDDYTFHGVFPEMSRQKWIDMIYQ
jgi:hypothetical protein